MLMRVVIVEDEDVIRWGLAHTLDWLDMGCVVVGDAASGEEGLRLIAQLQPHIVLTDIKMPDMDGLTMIERAREKHRFKSIILTSFPDFELAKRAIDLRASEYLLKPIDEEALKAAVKRIGQEVAQEELRQRLTACPAIHRADQHVSRWEGVLSSVQDDELARLTLQIIMDRSTDRLRADDVAAQLFVSTSYLSRRLKAVLGHTFLDLLNMYRVQQAIRLMLQEDVFLYEISDQTGFSDYKHFCNVFKRYLGLSPRDFLREWKACNLG